MEELLHYVWGHRLIDPAALVTSDGRRVQVIDPGLLNPNAGPDFFNAKVKIDGRLWCGNVEVHVRASDWARHGHSSDPAYDSVILHVVQHDDCQVCRRDGQPIPQLGMACSADFVQRYAEFVGASAEKLPCAGAIARMEPVHLRDWIDSMAIERLNDKAARVLDLLADFRGAWQDAAYVTLARSLGTGVNGDAFERLALATPLNLMLKHSDSLTAVEAMLFGQAGLIPDRPEGYAAELRREYDFYAAKFSLTPPPSLGWKMARMRPAAFPHRRIALLARLVAQGFRLMDQVLDAPDADAIREIFTAVTFSGHWASHYHLGAASSSSAPGSVSRATADSLAVNAAVPLLYAFGHATGSQTHVDRAIDILSAIPAERNSLVETFVRSGLECRDAFTSQAFIQMRRAYCDVRKCLYCRIGHRILAAKAAP